MKTYPYHVHAFSPRGNHLGDVIAKDCGEAVAEARRLWGGRAFLIEFEMDPHGAILDVRPEPRPTPQVS